MPSDQTPDPKTLSFLVIDDDEFARTVATLHVKGIGATDIATAADGEEALALLDAADRHPDVLLVDLSMPNMGGAEFLRHAASRGFEGRVILVSGLEEDTLNIAESAAKYQHVDVVAQIPKPLTLEKLREALGIDPD